VGERRTAGTKDGRRVKAGRVGEEAERVGGGAGGRERAD
jgi:hypothetical protein